MASIVLDLVVPGAGSAVGVLASIFTLCCEMKESQTTCVRVHERLLDIFSELQTMEDAQQLPPSDALGQYTQTLSRYLAYLRRYRDKKLYIRLLQHKKMMGELSQVNEEVDMVMKLLHLATTRAMMEWKQQWKEDTTAQNAAMKLIAENSERVLSEVRGLREQNEALTVIKCVLDRGELSPEEAAPVQKVFDVIVRASSAGVPSVPPWFIPPADLDYDPTPFARGSFGAVHRGTWGSGAKVVVKTLLLDDSGNGETAKKQFLHEIDLWYKLHHPNVVKMFGASHVTSPPFIVCEDATHGNLVDFLARGGNQSMWRLLREAAIGLEHLHKHSIVHGDLKLNNILVGSDGAARIADFGLSFVRTASASKSVAGASPTTGGMRWRAPECMEHRPTFASDTYSLAMCVIEAATGRPPFAYQDDATVYYLLRDGKIPSRPEAFPDAAWELVKDMTHKDLTQRISLAQAIATMKQLADVDDANASSYSKGIENTLRVDLSTHDTRDPEPIGVSSPRTATFVEPQDVSVSSEVASLMEWLRCGSTEQKETTTKRLYRLTRNLSTSLQIKQANCTQLLVDCVKDPRASRGQTLYAFGTLHQLWLQFDDITKSALAELAQSISSPSSSELDALLQGLAATAQDKEFALQTAELVTCHAVISTTTQDNLRVAGVIPALVAMLQVGSDVLLTQTLIALGALATENVVNQAAIVDAGGVVSVLVRQLKIGDDGAIEPAVRLIGLIASHAANNDALVFAGAVGPIVALLRSSRESHKAAAALTLAQLTAKNGAMCESIADTGAVELLVGMLKTGTDVQKQHAAQALAALVRNGSCLSIVEQCKGATALVELLVTGSEAQKEQAMSALARLAAQSSSARVAVAGAGGIELLVTALRNRSTTQETNAVVALAALVRESEAYSTAVVKAGGVKLLLGLMQRGSDSQAKAATRALACIACSNSGNGAAVAEAGGVEHLLGLVRSSTDEQRADAVGALAAMASSGAVDLDGIIELIGLAPFIALLRSSDDEYKHTVVGMLAVHTRSPVGARAVWKAGGIEPLLLFGRTTSGHNQYHTAHTIVNILSLQEARGAISETPGIVSVLLELMSRGDREQREAAMRGLERLAWNSTNRIVFGELKAATLMTACVGSDDEPMKQLAGQILHNLAVSIPLDFNELADAGGATTLVELLLHGDEETKELAALVLANPTCNNPEDRVAITNAGGIPPLVELLRRGNDAQKEHAARAIGNVAWGNAVNCKVIADAGGVDALLALTKDGNDIQKEYAARALAQVASNSDVSSSTSDGPSSVQPLVDLVRSGSAAQKEHAAKALGSLPWHGPSRVALGAAGGVGLLLELSRHGTETLQALTQRVLDGFVESIPMDFDDLNDAGGGLVLVELLRNGESKHKLLAAQALGNPACNNADDRAAIAAAGGIPPLVELVNSGDDDAKEWASRALGNIGWRSNANCMEIARVGGVKALLEVMKSGTEANTEYATRALMQLTSTRADVCPFVVAVGGVKVLIGLIRSGNAIRKEYAARVAANLVTHDARVCTDLAACGGIVPFVELVRGGNESQKEYAVRVVACLARTDASHRSAIAQARGIGPLVELVRGGLDVHKEFATRALANLAIEDENRIAIAQAGGVVPLVTMVKGRTGVPREFAARALANLALSDVNVLAITSAGGIPVLMELVRGGSDQEKEHALAAEANLAVNEPNCVAIAEGEGITTLVELARVGVGAQKEYSTRVLANVTSSSKPIRKATIKAGGVEVLLELLRSGTEEQSTQAARAVSYLMESKSTRAAVVAGGGVKELKRLVDASPPPPAAVHAKKALSFLGLWERVKAL